MSCPFPLPGALSLASRSILLQDHQSLSITSNQHHLHLYESTTPNPLTYVMLPYIGEYKCCVCGHTGRLDSVMHAKASKGPTPEVKCKSCGHKACYGKPKGIIYLSRCKWEYHSDSSRWPFQSALEYVIFGGFVAGLVSTNMLIMCPLLQMKGAFTQTKVERAQRECTVVMVNTLSFGVSTLKFAIVFTDPASLALRAVCNKIGPSNQEMHSNYCKLSPGCAHVNITQVASEALDASNVLYLGRHSNSLHGERMEHMHYERRIPLRRLMSASLRTGGGCE
jgi:DNA-directed RNA polymerase subunit RPC12/RpoP